MRSSGCVLSPPGRLEGWRALDEPAVIRGHSFSQSAGAGRLLSGLTLRPGTPTP